jgi:hypothetical protein
MNLIICGHPASIIQITNYDVEYDWLFIPKINHILQFAHTRGRISLNCVFCA